MVLDILEKRKNQIKNYQPFKEIFFFNSRDLSFEIGELEDFYEIEENRKLINQNIKKISKWKIKKIIKNEIKTINKYYKINLNDQLKEFKKKLKDCFFN